MNSDGTNEACQSNQKSGAGAEKWLSAVPRRNPAVVSRTLGVEAVLVFAQKGQVKILNETGAAIWDLADGSRTLAQIVEAIAGIYDVEPAQAEEDVLDFVRELVSKDLLALEHAV